jgi:hypothetical protein
MSRVFGEKANANAAATAGLTSSVVAIHGMAECLTRRLTSSTVRPVWRSFFAPEAPCLRLYYRTFRLIGAGTRTTGTPIPFLTTGGSDSKVVSPVQRPSRLGATPLTGNRLIHRWQRDYVSVLVFLGQHAYCFFFLILVGPVTGR